MKAFISPHSVVTVTYVDPSNVANTPRFRSITTVQQVQKGCLTVVEIASRNGLGKIVCVADSAKTGIYCYEYRNNNNEPKLFRVLSLTDAFDKILKLGSFID